MSKKAKTNMHFAGKDMAVYDDLRKEMIKFVTNRIVYWTNKMFPVDPKAMEALKLKDDTFERKPE